MLRFDVLDALVEWLTATPTLEETRGGEARWWGACCPATSQGVGPAHCGPKKRHEDPERERRSAEGAAIHVCTRCATPLVYDESDKPVCPSCGVVYGEPLDAAVLRLSSTVAAMRTYLKMTERGGAGGHDVGRVEIHVNAGSTKAAAESLKHAMADLAKPTAQTQDFVKVCNGCGWCLSGTQRDDVIRDAGGWTSAEVAAISSAMWGAGRSNDSDHHAIRRLRSQQWTEARLRALWVVWGQNPGSLPMPEVGQPVYEKPTPDTEPVGKVVGIPASGSGVVASLLGFAADAAMKHHDATLATQHDEQFVLAALDMLARRQCAASGGIKTGYSARDIAAKAGMSQPRVRSVLRDLAKRGMVSGPDGKGRGWCRIGTMKFTGVTPSMVHAAAASPQVDSGNVDRNKVYAWLARMAGAEGATLQAIADGTGLLRSVVAVAVTSLIAMGRVRDQGERYMLGEAPKTAATADARSAGASPEDITPEDLSPDDLAVLIWVNSATRQPGTSTWPEKLSPALALPPETIRASLQRLWSLKLVRSAYTDHEAMLRDGNEALHDPVRYAVTAKGHALVCGDATVNPNGEHGPLSSVETAIVRWLPRSSASWFSIIDAVSGQSTYGEAIKAIDSLQKRGIIAGSMGIYWSTEYGQLVAAKLGDA